MRQTEKYIRYIVEALLHSTKFTKGKGGWFVSFPFYKTKSLSYVISQQDPNNPRREGHSFETPFFKFFSKYVIEQYGVNDEEIDLIWFHFWSRLKTFVATNELKDGDIA